MVGWNWVREVGLVLLENRDVGTSLGASSAFSAEAACDSYP